MSYDFDSISSILTRAANQGRYSLYEHEVYEVLRIMGLNTPEYRFIPADSEYNISDPEYFKGRQIVLKVVSPLITHKTEAGGVLFDLKIEQIKNAVKNMKDSVPETYSAWLLNNKEMAEQIPGELLKDKSRLKQYLKDSIAGFIVVEHISYKQKPGTEILLGVKSDDAFGSVIMFGIGGTKVDFFNENMSSGKSFNIASADLLTDSEVRNFIKKPVIHKIFSGRLRGEKKIIEDSEIFDAVKKFRDLKKYYSNTNPETEWNIIECEVNPYVITNGKIVPLDGVLKFEKAEYCKVERPYKKLENLLNPKTVGIIGVSGKRVTPGSIILTNLLKSGIRAENIYLVHPQEKEIKGCRCYASFENLKNTLGSKKIDMFVVGVPASAPPGRAADDVIEQLINMELTESVMIITAGFGETEKGKEKSDKIKRLFADAHKRKDGGPVANGPNTLGNVFYNIDTKFTPKYKSSADGRGKQNCALVCQSGAFMITRQSDLAGIVNPSITLSIGNQIDLTMSDYLKFLKDREDIDVFGVYIEGFNRLDGLEFLKAAGEIVKNGKAVIAYKAGKTPEGKSAAKGHTAAAAGDYVVAKKLFEDTGVYVAEEFAEYQDLLMLFSLLSDTNLDFNKDYACTSALSNAGFEKCAIGDNIYDTEKLPYFNIAKMEPASIKKIEEVFINFKIADFMDISEILDMTPIANDEVFGTVIETILKDKNVDAGIFSIVPETVMLNTLDSVKDENIHDADSIIQRLIKIKKSTDKPFIVPFESGRLYEPVRKILLENGIPVFPLVDHAVRVFGKYLRYRMRNRL
ncbi:acetate--CoA ligase family protein [candidate division KSB1 bacterium]